MNARHHVASEAHPARTPDHSPAAVSDVKTGSASGSRKVDAAVAALAKMLGRQAAVEFLRGNASTDALPEGLPA